MIKPIFAILGLGVIELLILLGVAVLGVGLLAFGAAFLVQLSRRNTQASPPPPKAPSPPPPVIPATGAPAKCPQCREPLPGDAAEGLCPACLAKVALGSEPAAAADATIDINPLAAQAAPPTRVAPDPAQLAAQFPQLKIIELLGMGGMGMVYKARQPRVDRMVALKILPVESGRGPSFAERFQREAKALAKLNHPGIVTFYDFGQTTDYYYFIMEYVEGMNLRQLLQDHRLEPRQALELVTQICTALQYAHDEGVVHRDIKPENILLNKKGRVKIADFGLAKLLGSEPDTALTMSQATMGTMNYMAPEQRRNAQAVDHRADIYSLGVVFYEMLTGEVPMGRFEPPSKRVEVDVRLDEVVLKALEREPARRYQQASEVKSGVESITDSPPAAPAVPSATPAPAQAQVIPSRFLGEAPPAAAPSLTPLSSQPRLSSPAVAGAAWAFGFFPFAVMSLVIAETATFIGGGRPQSALQILDLLFVRWGTATSPGTPLWQTVLEITILTVGLTSPFGATVLGYVALSQIRYSARRRYGLGLALFDALLFPLLLVDGVVIMFLAGIVGFSQNMAGFYLGVGSLISIWLDYHIFRKVWRFCHRASGT